MGLFCGDDVGCHLVLGRKLHDVMGCVGGPVETRAVAEAVEETISVME